MIGAIARCTIRQRYGCATVEQLPFALEKGNQAMCDKSIDVCAVRESGERGIALVTVLLITSLVVVSLMRISLTAISEAGVGNTYANQERAFQAAEGELYHALSLVKNYSNGAAGDPTFTKLLAMRDFPTAAEKSLAEYRFPKPLNYLDHYNPFTDASLFSTGCSMITYEVDASGKTLGHQLTDADGNLVPGAYYTIHVIDDEPFVAGQDVTKPWVPNFNPPASPAWESGDHNTDVDTNNRLVVYSTGTYGSASVTLEGWIGFIPYPALVAQEDITVWGNSQINGAYGGVHSNDNLAVGASAYIEQTATAVNNFTQSGSSDIEGFHAGGQPALYIPKFVTTAPTTSGGPNTSPRLQDYVIRKADTLLIDPGYRDPLVDAQGRTGQQRSDELAARLNIDKTQLWTAINSTGSENAITITRSCSTCAGTVATASVSSTGWKYNNSNGWDVQGTAVKNHTFYVVGMDNYKLSNPS